MWLVTRFPDVCAAGGRRDGALYGALVKTVAGTSAGGAGCVRTGRREQVVPAHVAGRGRDFSGEAARQVDKPPPVPTSSM